MAILNTYTILFSSVLILGPMSIASTSEKGAISPVVITGNGVGRCPSDEERQADRELLYSLIESIYSAELQQHSKLWSWTLEMSLLLE